MQERTVSWPYEVIDSWQTAKDCMTDFKHSLALAEEEWSENPRGAYYYLEGQITNLLSALSWLKRQGGMGELT